MLFSIRARCQTRTVQIDLGLRGRSQNRGRTPSVLGAFVRASALLSARALVVLSVLTVGHAHEAMASPNFAL